MALLNRVFDLLLGPLGPLPLAASLAIVSLVTAVALLVVVRATSNPRALVAVKRQIHADLFEIRLFNDDLRAILRAQLDMFRHNATYLRLSLVPIAWAFIPLALVVVQLDSFFGYTGVAVGEPFIITAQLRSRDAVGDLGMSTIEAPPGIRLETPAVSFPGLQQLVWRLVADAPGDHTVTLRIGGETYTKAVHASNGLARRSPVRPARGWRNQLRYPSEFPLPESGLVDSLIVAYPERQVTLFGWSVSWMVVYIVETIFFAFLLKSPLRVTL